MNWILSLLMLMITCPCLARVDIKTTKPMIIPVDKVTPKITKKDVEQIIPTDFTPDDGSSTVFSRIADRGFNYWYKNSEFKNSAVGRAAESAQEKLKTDVVVPSNKKGMNHKFSFRVEAFQTLAKMEYSGWTKAAINYNAARAQTNFEVSEKVWKDKDLVLSHSVTSRENVSSAGVKWSW